MKNLRKNSFRFMIALTCVGMICLFIHVTNQGKETENKFSSSEEYEDIFYTENFKEEQPGTKERQEDYDRWETEHILEIGFGYGETVTQDDIIHIGRSIHLKRLKISVGDDEINLSSLSNLVELESLDMDIQYGCSPDLSFIAGLSQV